MIKPQLIVWVDVDEKSSADFWQIQSDSCKGLDWLSSHLDINISGIVVKLIEEVP